MGCNSIYKFILLNSPCHKLMQFHPPCSATSVTNLGIVRATTCAKAQLTKGRQILQGGGIPTLPTGCRSSGLLAGEPLHLVLEVEDDWWCRFRTHFRALRVLWSRWSWINVAITSSISSCADEVNVKLFIGRLALLKVFIGQYTIESIRHHDNVQRAVARGGTGDRTTKNVEMTSIAS